MGITDLPIEIVEYILSFLDGQDFTSCIAAIENEIELSDRFWMKLCHKYDCEPEEYSSYKDCYIHLTNLKLAKVKAIKCPLNFSTIQKVHMYKNMLLVPTFSFVKHQLWKACSGKFELMQTFRSGNVVFFGKTLVIRKFHSVDIYSLDDIGRCFIHKTQVCVKPYLVAANDNIVAVFCKDVTTNFVFCDTQNGMEVAQRLNISTVSNIKLNEYKIYILNEENIKIYDVKLKSWWMTIPISYSCFHMPSRYSPEMHCNSNFIVLYAPKHCFTNNSYNSQILTFDGAAFKTVCLNIKERKTLLCCFWKDKAFVAVAEKLISIIDKNTCDVMSLAKRECNGCKKAVTLYDLQAGPLSLLFITANLGLDVYDWKMKYILHSFVPPTNATGIIFNKFILCFTSPINGGIVLDFTDIQASDMITFNSRKTRAREYCRICL